jgi:hypothetical protein
MAVIRVYPVLSVASASESTRKWSKMVDNVNRLDEALADLRSGSTLQFCVRHGVGNRLLSYSSLSSNVEAAVAAFRVPHDQYFRLLTHFKTNYESVLERVESYMM